jgi:alpha-amylase
MHKKMLRLSRLARATGDPPAARRAIGRAQCNDAYWHGVFGGLYLPHLRAAIWRELARAEAALRAGEPLGWERTDFDEDGHEELWIRSAAFSAIVSPRRGGGIEEYTRFAVGANYADVLTRRLEAYHEVAPSLGPTDVEGGTPSIHAIERGLGLAELPPVDREPRALFQERLLSPSATAAMVAAGRTTALSSWAQTPLTCDVTMEGERVRVTLATAEDPHAFRKTYVFSYEGLMAVEFAWRPPRGDAWFSTEVSHQGTLALRPTPAAEVWDYPVETLAKSERGFQRTAQGQATVLRWPASLGAAGVTVDLPGTP